jgi:hypothetical protein
MLHEFLTLHHDELINRCRSRVRQRFSPPATPSELEHGVPLFLGQLVAALRDEAPDAASEETAISATSEAWRSASLHGRELLGKGYTVEQVVHGYGDVCQCMTEMAMESSTSFSVAEYRVFNRMLDNAIAAAVSSYRQHRDASTSAEGALDLHQELGTLADQQGKLIDTALTALDALKIGNIGLLGATGTVLEDSLVQLRGLVDKALPEIRLKTGMSLPPNWHE